MLKDVSEAGTVRHKAAEALKSIASDDCVHVLRSFINNKEDVVRDLAVVADWIRYEGGFEVLLCSL